MNNKVLCELLKKNGLSERESKVYSVLLENPNSTPTQVHNQVGITRTKIYEILSSLLSKNLIAEELVGKKKAYRTLNPASSLSTLVRKKENEFKIFKENNDKLVTLAKDLYDKVEIDKPPSYQLEHLSDPAIIKDRYQYYVSKAKHEVLIFLKPPYVTSDIDPEKALKKGLKIKTLVEYHPVKYMDNLISFIDAESKDEIRFIDELPVKLSVIDSKISVLALGANGSKTGQINTIFLDEPIIAKFIKEIFESRWKKGLSLEKYREHISKEI